VDLTGIRQAIANNALSADGLDDAKHYEPEMVAGSPTFWVVVTGYEASAMGRNRWKVELEGKLQLLGTWDRSKSDAADRLVGLVWTAIEIDGDLGGLACDVQVERVRFDSVDETGAMLVTYEIAVEA